MQEKKCPRRQAEGGSEQCVSVDIVNNASAVKQAKLGYARPLDQGDLFGASSPPRSIVNSDVTGRSCKCGSESFILGPGVGPHTGGKLECTLCGGISWLAKARAATLPTRSHVMEGTAL
jgi:hypothetical protein